MKTENTLENKARFFAQYYGQRVLRIREKDSPQLYVGFDDLQTQKAIEEDYLELTPLSEITDEDAIEAYSIINKSIIKNDKEFSEIVIKKWACSATMLQTLDFLRSKGYALPWMDLSVEDLIAYGWVKLKD